MPPGNVVVLAELGAAEPAEVAFRLVRASAVLAHELDGVIDALHVVSGHKAIPTRRFVGVDNGAGSDALADQWEGINLAGDNPRNDPAISLTLARNGDDLAAKGRKPPIAPIRLAVVLPLMTAEVCAVNFDRAGQLASGLYFGGHRFAEFVAKDKGGHVGNVQVAPELQSRDAFDRVHEDRNGGEVIADCQLARVKQRPAGHGELFAARLAFEDAARGVRINLRAAAMRAKRLAIVL